MGIGKKLDELIKKRGTNVNELAKNIDIAPTTIYSIIKRDNKKVDIDVLLKISKELGVRAEYFMDYDDNQTYKYDDSSKIVQGVNLSEAQFALYSKTDDLTDEELEDVANYINFLKSKRDK